MGHLLKFIIGFTGMIALLYWIHVYAPYTNTPFAPSQQQQRIWPKDESNTSTDRAEEEVLPDSVHITPSMDWKTDRRLDSLLVIRLFAEQLLERMDDPANAAARKEVNGTIEGKNYTLSIQLDTLSHGQYWLSEAYYDEMVYLGIWQYNSGKWKQLSLLTYTFEDSPTCGWKDVNGDGYEDYWIYRYGSSGCCVRHRYDLYLYQPAEKDFTFVAWVLNPTFYPEEQLIRGVTYGHPEDAELYTYRWNGNQLDTVEYIEPNCTNGPFTCTLTRRRWVATDSSWQVIEEPIDSVPAAYQTVEERDWLIY